MTYPCVKCGNNCCRLEECKKFPCELIKENCSVLWNFIQDRKRGDLMNLFNLIPRKDFPNTLELENIKREIREFDKYLKRLETEGREYFK